MCSEMVSHSAGHIIITVYMRAVINLTFVPYARKAKNLGVFATKSRGVATARA